jgi:Concanavalin A-like lectin/glucanases superfamily
MVLTQRSGALGFALSFVLGCVLLAGCDQSLFDANGAAKGGGGDDDSAVPSTCPDPCVADAAGDFDGSSGGTGNHWRYLDDHRNRTWKPMTAVAVAMIGEDQSNQITTCAARPDAPACKALPGALLVSSAGATSNADPAIEVTAPTAQVLKLSLRAYVPTGDDQTIRIYRNSREDVLFTGTATAGMILDQAVTLDALAGDRFLVALAPDAKGATDVGLHVFVNATGAVFPAKCQVAVSFTAAAGNTVDNLCGGDFTHALFDGNKDTAPALAAGPYTELGSAADFTSDNYFRGTDPLDKSHDTTLQFWVKWRQAVPLYDDAWVFSDLDYSSANSDGLAVVIRNLSPPTLEVAACDTAMPSCWRDIAYPSNGSWQFVRVVHTNGNLDVCLNGVRKTSFPAAAGSLQSTFPPNFGNNHQFLPQGAFFDGQLDDVRVFTAALPCE